MLSGWRSVNALASHRCDPGSIPGVGMWDGHVVTKSDRYVFSGFLQHKDHRNANIGAMINITYIISCVTCFVIVFLLLVYQSEFTIIETVNVNKCESVFRSTFVLVSPFVNRPVNYSCFRCLLVWTQTSLVVIVHGLVLYSSIYEQICNLT